MASLRLFWLPGLEMEGCHLDMAATRPSGGAFQIKFIQIAGPN